MFPTGPSIVILKPCFARRRTYATPRQHHATPARYTIRGWDFSGCGQGRTQDSDKADENC
jgi:hypothetical protein